MNPSPKYKLAIFLLFLSFVSYSQKVNVIKIKELENRINNTSDTTYIVNFWATWCVPCIKELPAFDSVHLLHSSEKVKVILVTLDFSEDKDNKVIPFIQKKQIRSEVLLLDETNGNYFIPKVSDKWSGAIPATLIVNNEKKYREFFEKKLDYKFLTDQIHIISQKP